MECDYSSMPNFNGGSAEPPLKLGMDEQSHPHKKYEHN